MAGTHRDAFKRLQSTPGHGSVYWNGMSTNNNPDFSHLSGLSKKMSTLSIGQVAPSGANSKKTTFRSIADDDHFFVNHVDGFKISSVTTSFGRGFGNYGAGGDDYKPWDVSFDHGEGEKTVIAKYDKSTLAVLASKSMKEMWIEYMGANVDSHGNTYPMDAPYGFKDNAGKHRPQIMGPFVTCRGPLAQHGDLMRTGPGPSGLAHAFGSNLMTTDPAQAEALEQYWSMSGFDNKGHFLTANTYVGTVTESTTTKVVNDQTLSMLTDANGKMSSPRDLWLHKPVGLIDIAVYNATTMTKVHDVLFYQPKPAMHSIYMSLKGFTILPDDTVIWGDGSNEVVILDYMQGKLVKQIELAGDHSNPVGPIVSNAKLIIVGTKAQRFSGTEFSPTPLDALNYGITPFGVPNAGA